MLSSILSYFYIIGDVYKNFFIETLGLSFSQYLLCIPFSYAITTYLIYWIRKWFTGDYQTIFIKEFSDKNYCPKISESSKLIVFCWNIMMIFVSIIMFVFTWNIYVEYMNSHDLCPYTYDDFVKYLYVPNNYYIHDVPNTTDMAVKIAVAGKLMEFVDTMLYLAIGTPLLLLHFWHHATTAIVVEIGRHAFIGAPLLIINNAIHIVMYTYYSLSYFKSLRKILTSIKIFITVSQIIQFIFVIYMDITTWLPHNSHYRNLIYFDSSPYSPIYDLYVFLIITSYLVLFVKFFVDTYLGKKIKNK